MLSEHMYTYDPVVRFDTLWLDDHGKCVKIVQIDIPVLANPRKEFSIILHWVLRLRDTRADSIPALSVSE